MSQNKTLIIIPSQVKGGVYNFYRNLYPYLPDNYLTFYLKKVSRFKFYNLIINLIRFTRLFYIRNDISRVLINPSLLFNSIITSSIISLISKFQNKKVIVFWRGWDFKNEKYLKFPYNVLTKHLLKVDHCIVLYSKVKKSLIELGYKNTFSKLSTMPGDDAYKYTYTKNINFRILFLSRIEIYKGIYELVDAFKILSQKYLNIELNIAGFGSEISNIKTYIDNNNIRNVNFHGYLLGHSKFNLISNSDVFVLPSYSEGMPNALLESMMVGIPVVTTKVGAINDFFEEDKMGFFIEIKDPKSIVKSVEKIMIYNKKNEIGIFNKKFAYDNFSTKHIIKKFISATEI